MPCGWGAASWRQWGYAHPCPFQMPQSYHPAASQSPGGQRRSGRGGRCTPRVRGQCHADVTAKIQLTAARGERSGIREDQGRGSRGPEPWARAKLWRVKGGRKSTLREGWKTKYRVRRQEVLFPNGRVKGVRCLSWAPSCSLGLCRGLQPPSALLLCAISPSLS